MNHYLPSDALHLIERLIKRHPPVLVWSVAGFFVFQVVMARLRSGRWMDSIILSVIVTVLLAFVAACVYLLMTQPGYHFFFRNALR